MTLGPPVSPVPSLRYRWLLLPLFVGLAVGTAMYVMSRPTTAPRAAPEPYVCVLPEAPQPPPAPEPPPARPVPGPEVWARLDACLLQPGVLERPYPTAAEIRGWIAEGDPVWFDEGAWWFPLSGEGDAQMPSGDYVVVPLGAGPCGGAIVN